MELTSATVAWAVASWAVGTGVLWLCTRTCWRLIRTYYASFIPGAARWWKAGAQPGQEGLFRFLEALHERHGPVVHYWDSVGGLNVSIADPALLAQLDIDRLEKRVEAIAFLKGLLGVSGISFMTGKAAKERRHLWHRLLSSQPFQQEVLPNFILAINQHISAWPKDQGVSTIEVEEDLRAVWLKLNEYNAFGVGVNAEPLYKAFEDAVKLLQKKPFLYMACHALLTSLASRSESEHIPDALARATCGIALDWIAKFRWQQRRLLCFIHAEVDRLVADQVQHTATSNPYDTWGHGHMLSLLLDARHPNGQPTFSRRQIHDEVLTLLFGVSDNGLAVSSCLHKIAINPEVQRRLQTEVDEAWKGHTPTTISELLALKLVRGAFLEALRFTGGAVWRITRGWSQVGSYTIPPDTTIVVPLSLLHSHKNYWPQPTEFRPERFVGGARPKLAAAGDMEPPGGHHLAFLAFGTGLRGCLGQRYAQHTVTLLMGMILQRYTVELAPNTGPELQLKQLNLTYGSKHGVFLRFIPRSACHV